VVEITACSKRSGVDVNVVAPLGATPADLLRLPEADFNVCLYPETARQPPRGWSAPSAALVRTVPIGVGATRDFIARGGRAGRRRSRPALAAEAAGLAARLPWYSRSVDSTYLTGKRVFIFGDATHAMAAARIAREELGFEVVGLGTYSREFAREVREAPRAYGVEALITDDYLEVEAAIASCSPSWCSARRWSATSPSASAFPAR
jgi:light-independent protochlorophyllide reductase subunit B